MEPKQEREGKRIKLESNAEDVSEDRTIALEDLSKLGKVSLYPPSFLFKG